jgi:hypothetical protein
MLYSNVFLKELQISSFEERIIHEIEIRILQITYQQIVTEDREEMVTCADREAVQSAFATPVKNYRIIEGMGVTFHCKMAGTPLPKVVRKHVFLYFVSILLHINVEIKHLSIISYLSKDRMVQRWQAYPSWRPLPDGESSGW